MKCPDLLIVRLLNCERVSRDGNKQNVVAKRREEKKDSNCLTRASSSFSFVFLGNHLSSGLKFAVFPSLLLVWNRRGRRGGKTFAYSRGVDYFHNSSFFSFPSRLESRKPTCTLLLFSTIPQDTALNSPQFTFWQPPFFHPKFFVAPFGFLSLHENATRH